MIQAGGSTVFMHQRWPTYLCWTIYILGVIWFLLHPIVTISTGQLRCRNTYISENELLIESIEAQFSTLETQTILASHTYPNGSLRDPLYNQIVTKWLIDQLETIPKVSAFTQSFSGNSHRCSRCTNVYGILKASPLADGKESIVLIAHPPQTPEDLDKPFSSVAVGMGLLRHLSQVKWLAKDIIFLISDDGPTQGSDGYSPGTQAWLEAYFSDPVLNAETLAMRAGVIRAAINLEITTQESNQPSFSLLVSGENGQLPNLDLINVAILAFQKNGIVPSMSRCRIHDQLKSEQGCSDMLSTAFIKLNRLLSVIDYFPFFSYPTRDIKKKWGEYLFKLHGMVRFMVSLAIGPTGSHAAFISYNIDSITTVLNLPSRKRSGTEAQHENFLEATLQGLELMIRSLSNLEEKLHQSFYLYLLPTAQTFVSVGEYIYPLLMLCAPLVLELARISIGTSGLRMAYAFISFVIVESFGLGLLYLSFHFPRASPWLLIFCALLEITAGLLLLSIRKWPQLAGCSGQKAWNYHLRSFENRVRKTLSSEVAIKHDQEPSERVEKPDEGWNALKFITMLLIVYGHCMLGFINYSMAWFCALSMVIFALIRPHAITNSGLKCILALWLLLASPSILLWLLSSHIQQSINWLVTFYLYALHFPVHALSLVIFFFPVNVESKRI
nr:transmembrane protein putative [Albugo laibachii Nc14]|eukprot:CCA14462.1 transmembrane protein putative [Albugo laibachii Nc14]